MGPGGFPGATGGAEGLGGPVCSLARAPEVAWGSGVPPGRGPGAGRAAASPGPAPTTVALGGVPVSGLKSAAPARACPGPWQRPRNKHWKVGRARAHGGLQRRAAGEGAACPEVWARPGRWGAAARRVGAPAGAREGLRPTRHCWLACHRPGSDPGTTPLSRPGGLPSPAGPRCPVCAVGPGRVSRRRGVT